MCDAILVKRKQFSRKSILYYRFNISSNG